MESRCKFKSTGKKHAVLLINSIVCITIFLLPNQLVAQQETYSSTELKKLSLEQLMNVEVSSVSKRPEKLIEAASAIQVISQADIHNSGAKTLAEALKLASNLQVAQVNSSQWAISARGFNNVLANKLLVLIDGRRVYTPLYAGVFWDVQNLILEDVDRIEVISGPGGTLWGANAVNGVINVITKSTKDTHGLLVEGAIGSNLPGLGSMRYGGQLNNDLSYRIYGTGFKIGNTLDTTDLKAKDEWPMIQGGFQLDWDVSDKNKITIQQNIYHGRTNPNGRDTSNVVRGNNIGIRWDHKRSEKSNFLLQAYYDHTFRDFKNGFTEDLKTYTIEWLNRYKLGNRHMLSYGLNFSMLDHKVTNLVLFKFLPKHKELFLYSAFLQDEIILRKDRLRLTLGAKLEHNSYTGMEYQPNARLTWTPSNKKTIWGAASRAVRTPSRIDREFFLNLNPDLLLISGNDNFKSENMLAYELGLRQQLMERISVSLATFFNVYDNIRSVEPGPLPNGFPFTFGNGVKGKTYGMEISASHQVSQNWSLRGGYTFLKKELSVKPTSMDLNGGNAESNDPANQFLIQSNIKLPGRMELGTVIRYIDKLPEPLVPGYFGIDVRVGWQLSKTLELNLVGQNIMDGPHLEFIPSSPSPRQIEPSIYGKITWRY